MIAALVTAPNAGGSRAPRAPLQRLLVLGVLSLSGCTLDADIGGWDGPDAALETATDAASDTSDADNATCASPSADAGACAADASAPASWLLKVTLGLTTSYFADGRSLPAGEYSVVYVDGCWKSGVVAWTVNLGVEGYWVVGGRPEAQLAMAPGSGGTFATLGAFGTYDECIAANVGRPGVTFRFDGGPIGLKLESLDPLTRFILLEGGESVGGQSPTFRLTCSGPCR